MEPRNSFVFYRSFYEAAIVLKAKDQLALFQAICEYALDGTCAPLSPTPDAMFRLVKPVLDSNQRRYENGKKGGRPKTNREPAANHPVSTPEPYVDADADGEEDVI